MKNAKDIFWYLEKAFMTSASHIFFKTINNATISTLQFVGF